MEVWVLGRLELEMVILGLLLHRSALELYLDFVSPPAITGNQDLVLYERLRCRSNCDGGTGAETCRGIVGETARGSQEKANVMLVQTLNVWLRSRGNQQTLEGVGR